MRVKTVEQLDNIVADLNEANIASLGVVDALTVPGRQYLVDMAKPVLLLTKQSALLNLNVSGTRASRPAHVPA